MILVVNINADDFPNYINYMKLNSPNRHLNKFPLLYTFIDWGSFIFRKIILRQSNSIKLNFFKIKNVKALQTGRSVNQ